MFRPYTAPGTKNILPQPSSMSCWATVYTMMISWKRRQCISINDAIAALGQKWLNYLTADNGLPGHEGQNFERTAGIVREPRMNYTLEGWSDLLWNHGLLWVSHAGLTSAGRLYIHDRIVEGIVGNGSVQGTSVKIIDPDRGRQYMEPFRVFLPNYERQADSRYFSDAQFYADYQVLRFR
jgi:hypothetical protein